MNGITAVLEEVTEAQGTQSERTVKGRRTATTEKDRNLQGVIFTILAAAIRAGMATDAALTTEETTIIDLAEMTAQPETLDPTPTPATTLASPTEKSRATLAANPGATNLAS